MNIFHLFKKVRIFYRWFKKGFPLKDEFGAFGENSILQYPVRIYSPKQVFVEDNVKISAGCQILNAPTEKVIIRKYSAFAANCTFVPNNHISTVTIPQFLLGASHVNDKSADIIIDEDVWLGTGVTIMSGVHIGRGCIVGAGSIVTKSLPPYALAVGSPAKIVKKKFTVEQILAHEKALYPECERLTREELEANEHAYFEGKSAYGTDTGLDETAVKQVEKMKKVLNFISHK